MGGLKPTEIRGSLDTPPGSKLPHSVIDPHVTDQGVTVFSIPL